MLTLRDYQLTISNKAVNILQTYGIVYLAMQVRTGKTLTSLHTAEKYGANKVLFITKKKAISSIEDDYSKLNPFFKIEIINYESLHKVTLVPDFLIVDEAHRVGGAYPKPSKTAKEIKNKYSSLPMILLSGTPTPESYSQIYHQLWLSDKSVFSRYKTFYLWAKEFVTVVERTFGYGKVNDYSRANYSKIKPHIEPIMINYTQEQAGFKSVIKEEIHYIDMKPITHQLADKLIKDKIIKGKKDVILADTSVKLQNKLHQIYSGTCIGESGDVIHIDDSKAQYISKKFNGKKVAIFYKFKAELEAIKKAHPSWQITEDIHDFNMGLDAMHIALQIVSGREGISLRRADYIVYYNIDFSAVSYWQSRDRMTTLEREENTVIWLFSRGGIEEKIYKAVQDKKKYTLEHFKEDYKL